MKNVTHGEKEAKLYANSALFEITKTYVIIHSAAVEVTTSFLQVNTSEAIKRIVSKLQ